MSSYKIINSHRNISDDNSVFIIDNVPGYAFFECEIEIKSQNKLVDYFKETINIPVEIKREHGLAVFYTSKQSYDKAVDYVYNNYESIINKFHLSVSILYLLSE